MVVLRTSHPETCSIIMNLLAVIFLYILTPSEVIQPRKIEKLAQMKDNIKVLVCFAGYRAATHPAAVLWLASKKFEEYIELNGVPDDCPELDVMYPGDLDDIGEISQIRPIGRFRFESSWSSTVLRCTGSQELLRHLIRLSDHEQASEYFLDCSDLFWDIIDL